MAEVTESLFTEFQPVSTEDWQAAIVKDLKGGDPAKLLWKTEDGITVKPFYRTEDAPSPAPVPTRPQTGWRVLYEINESDAATARAAAKHALGRGAQEIVYTGLTVGHSSDVVSLAGSDAPVHFKLGDGAEAALQMLAASGTTRIAGTIDYDPTVSGKAVDANLVNKARQMWPEFSPIGVRAEAWQLAGATTVEELALAIAGGVAQLNALGAEAASSLVFHFGVGTNYFFEIAKLRAARLLWAQVLEAYGVSGSMVIHARTSMADKTVYDPHNNLLRGTTEAMSAVLGGADAVIVVPFDEPYRRPDEFSRHLALNTQIILREEAHFDKVADPAAGSWYIESLTESIAREAWKLFQVIEAEGGLLAFVQSGKAEALLAKSRDARRNLIETRRRVIVGTNQYPNVREQALGPIDQSWYDANKTGRLAEPFEAIRLATERHAAKTGKAPAVLLLPLGDVKMRRARADYITNFFGVSGFTISEPAAFDSPEAAADYASTAKADIIVLCSSDPEYPVIAGPIVSRLRQGGVQTPVLVAGLPKDGVDAIKAAGVEDFIHVKSHPVQTLSSWQKRLGVIA